MIMRRIDNAQWSLTTFSVSCVKVGMNNNSSTASVEDTRKDKSRFTTATSAAVSCWASNRHTYSAMDGQKKKNQECILNKDKTLQHKEETYTYIYTLKYKQPEQITFNKYRIVFQWAATASHK